MLGLRRALPSMASPLRKFSASSSPKPPSPSIVQRFWSWTTQRRPHWRDCPTEAAVLFTVFGITGSSSVMLVRPGLKAMGLEGNMKDGPWSYRILSLLIVSPIYSVVLITLGTLSGRHLFFANMGGKILKRFVPKKVGERIICPPAAASNTVTTAAKAAKKG